MATQCPISGGSSVFAAQNLYNNLTEQNIIFDNDCESVNYAGRRVRHSKVKTEEAIDKVNIYPNPTQGYLFIDLPETNKPCWQITITNSIGSRVVEKIVKANVTKTYIELKGNAGIYFVNVLNCNTGKQQTRKVILQ